MTRTYLKAGLASAVTLAGLAHGDVAHAELLRAGQSISVNQRLYTDRNLHFVTLTDDGRLMLVRNDGRISWATNTRGSGAVIASMQTDGNFVIYNAQSQPVWSTGTWGPDRVFGVDPAGRVFVMKPTKKNRTKYLQATEAASLGAAGGKMEWNTPRTSFLPY